MCHCSTLGNTSVFRILHEYNVPTVCANDYMLKSEVAFWFEISFYWAILVGDLREVKSHHQIRHTACCSLAPLELSFFFGCGGVESRRLWLPLSLGVPTALPLPRKLFIVRVFMGRCNIIVA